jgi:hypothetical protein
MLYAQISFNGTTIGFSPATLDGVPETTFNTNVAATVSNK